MKTRIVTIFFLCLFLNPYAYAEDDLGMGQIATNLMQPLGLLLSLIYTACFIIGGALILASIIKYIEHKRSPLMISLSLVITLLFSGLILIFFPFISYLSGHGYFYVFTPLQEYHVIQ